MLAAASEIPSSPIITKLPILTKICKVSAFPELFRIDNPADLTPEVTFSHSLAIFF